MNLKKKSIIATSFIALISASFVSFAGAERPVAERVSVPATASASTPVTKVAAVATNTVSTVANLYNEMNLQAAGLSKQAFELAAKGYEKLKGAHRLGNERYLTIVDFSQSSRAKRFYLIDMISKKLVTNTFVAHGKNTGVDQANSFSNVPSSNKSSLGFYLTKGTYSGKHGTSLKLSGIEKGFNDNAEARAIVVHAADYVNAGRVNSAYMGRSQGCPALPNDVAAEVIDKIKNGSAMFLYYPEQAYLNGSQMINS
ncbi:murein L,D-transpeptidase catalytic domain family protein [Polluticoccus soli]|uniref:murein L,D-transpeptidase catalytic domain family protein n=1 Tax=Polluticoccus soli TaxID=3034150 RepID=UPI0023E1DA4F|nr:murein L,D-transpeptidase catalytic domain family protein [Flavipsychrobacter sp. JY13-12]